MKNADDEIARHRGGTARLKDIDVASAWKSILASPKKRARAAKALGVTQAELDRITDPPVVLKRGRSGIAGAEILVWLAVWVGTEIVLGSFKDLAKEELKKRIKKLWSDVLEPEVRDQLPDAHGLGPRVDK